MTKLEVLMIALRKRFWSKAKVDETLDNYIDPKLKHGGVPEDDLYIMYALYFAGEHDVLLKPANKWPEDWLKLTAQALSAQL